MSAGTWVEGNSIRLLENGEEFFPRVFEAVGQAKREVLIETFILFEDEVGMGLHAALIAAAARGVKVDITVDGWGSADLSERFMGELAAAGVRLHRVDHQPRIFGVRPNFFRRMHRKLVVIDQATGFIGGINYSIDHLLQAGPKSKQDYAVEVHGPIVDDMHRFMHSALAPSRRQWRRLWRRPRQPARPFTPTTDHAGAARAMLVTRDNHRRRTAIERHYMASIRGSRQRLIIANAYFLPGFRLLRQLAKAARRGVTVDLIVQGNPDMPIAGWGPTASYAYLIRAGVRVHEYRDRPLHGKVAVMDEQWATVGSSNLDPFSLALNLEANLIIMDAEFNRLLGERLLALIQQSCRQVDDPHKHHTLLRGMASALLFHLLRWLPRYIAWLPRHLPSIRRAKPVAAAQPSTTEATGNLEKPPR